MNPAELRQLIDQQPPAVRGRNLAALAQAVLAEHVRAFAPDLAAPLVGADVINQHARTAAKTSGEEMKRFVACGHDTCRDAGCLERRRIDLVFPGRADAVNARLGGGLKAEMGAKKRARGPVKTQVQEWMDATGTPTFAAASYVWQPVIAKGRRRDTDSIALWAKNALDGLVRAGLVVDDGPDRNLGLAILPCKHEKGADDRVELAVFTNQPLPLSL